MKIVSFSGEYRCLSNFWWFNGTTVEHLFQASKTDDPDWAMRIRSARSPGLAKRLGRQCPMRPTWEQERIPVMRSLLVVKFRETELNDILLETGDAKLIEGNTWGDTFWGVCNGVGENHLGKLLMWVRSAFA